jgi:alkylhydroperoxidase family enzyme
VLFRPPHLPILLPKTDLLCHLATPEVSAIFGPRGSNMATSSSPAARIPYRPASVLPKGIPPLNLFRMWAHSPSTLPHVLSLGTACFRDTSLSPYQRGLICLLNANRVKCEYQWKQHVPIAKAAGVSDAQIAALAAADISGSLWSQEDKALLHFLDAVIEGPEVSEPVFERARGFFSDQILVEVVTIQVRSSL